MGGKERLLGYLRGEILEKPEYEVFLTTGCENMINVDFPVVNSSVFSSGYDDFGCHWQFVWPNSHPDPKQKPIVQDIEEWKSYIHFPNVEKYDWESMKAQCANLDRENNVINAALAIGPLERAEILCSFEENLVYMLTNPEEWFEMASALTDWRIKTINRICECSHPDVVTIHDDFGSTKGPLFSPAMWKELYMPLAKRMYEAIHAHGALVCQHSCGCLGEIADMVCEAGADIWEAQANVNPVNELREKYRGKMVIVAPEHAEIPPQPMEDLDELSNFMLQQGPLRCLVGHKELPTWLWD